MSDLEPYDAFPNAPGLSKHLGLQKSDTPPARFAPYTAEQFAEAIWYWKDKCSIK